MPDPRFEEWAIIELFGHQRIAGKVSNQEIGGACFIRVDVPPVEDRAGFTKLFGSGAIYAITITDEATATAAAGYYEPDPMNKWTIKEMLESRALPEHADDEC
ncbi:MAG: hypothetical protein JXR37_09120 [Kiritimatiellae bacterium]|nr:hypothetical protein [Kiritimatiellia bacterium]